MSMIDLSNKAIPILGKKAKCMNCGILSTESAIILAYRTGYVGVQAFVFCLPCAGRRFGGLDTPRIGREDAAKFARAMADAVEDGG